MSITFDTIIETCNFESLERKIALKFLKKSDFLFGEI